MPERQAERHEQTGLPFTWIAPGKPLSAVPRLGFDLPAANGGILADEL